MTFAACSNDELGEITPNPVVNDVVEGATFEIAISNQGVGTKATRPMGSSAADNSVNCVVLKVYKESGGTWTEVTQATSEEGATSGSIALKYVSGDAITQVESILSNGVISYNADEEESVPGTDQSISKRAKIEVVGLQKDTKYQIVAYGYNSSNTSYPYTGGPTLQSTGFENNGVFQANVTSYTNPYTQLEEIFAATDVAETTEIGDEEKQVVFTVTPSLTLTRQVAGMLAYFKNVPAFLNIYNNPSAEKQKVEKLQIVANHTAKDFYFPAMLLDNDDFNGIMADTDGEEVLMEFDFSNIATNYNETDIDFYTFNEAKMPAEESKTNPFAEGYTGINNIKLVANSIFGARYLLPYDKHYTESTTLKLRFLGKDDVLLEERDVTTANVPNGGTQYAYDIRCNNFYSIGQKLETDTTDPDPEEPDDEDKPIDLTGKTIQLRINDAWAVLHNMGIE